MLAWPGCETSNLDDYVKATEIGSYAYCPEAWRLGDGLRLRSSNEFNLRRSEQTHVETAKVELRSQSASRAGWVLLIVAGLILLAIVLFYSAGR
ncbi:hypothetical protein [Singulisphaera sp. GP187]|uniref:hypothetical protein n=1 Tax=Singulisphaera sp. GP187 TaxID=1882752 RepID=UPI0009411587|nr:hypothetical protein [Singulisphaera sp. GP187]